MNKILIIFFLFCSPVPLLAQSDPEMYARSVAGNKKADKQLNVVYRSLLKRYAGDTNFLNNLKASQRIWIQFRDAEMQLKYPDQHRSSDIQMCWLFYQTELIEARTKALRIWLDGEEEGDICSGSVPNKQIK